MDEKKYYKVKLSNARVLGPIDIDRIKLLVARGVIQGKEKARRYPEGDWQDISLIKEIQEIFLKNFETPNPPKPSAEKLIEIKNADLSKTIQVEADEQRSEELEKTILAKENPFKSGKANDFNPITSNIDAFKDNRFSEQKTILFEGFKTKEKLERKSLFKKYFKPLVIGLIVVYFCFELFTTPKQESINYRSEIIRPKIPVLTKEKTDPELSKKYYEKAIRNYLADNVVSYKKALKLLHLSVYNDPSNVKAMAILASTYLNLMESSNKDDKYFGVIGKIIELAKAKGVDLPETVIAETEYLQAQNKNESAQEHIIEYTRKTQKFGLEMYYFLAQSSFNMGEFEKAADILNNIVDSKAFSPKVFYLRGLVNIKLGNDKGASDEFEKAIVNDKNHALSRVRILDLSIKQSNREKAKEQIEFLTKNISLLSPKSAAEAQYFAAVYFFNNNDLNRSLGYAEKALSLDSENPELQLLNYTLRARLGDTNEKYKEKAKMYLYLSEAQKKANEGRIQEAITSFVLAHEANLKSPLPPLRLGEFFFKMNDLVEAKRNLKVAVDLAPSDQKTTTTYVKVLVASYEFEEAKAILEKSKRAGISIGNSEKIQADIYLKQEKISEAIAFYQKALSRDVVDTDTYTSYADALFKARQYSLALFFYSLSLRTDPLNMHAVLGTAGAMASSDSIDRAIQFLNSENQKRGKPRAEIVSAIAELLIQKGEWDLAEKTVLQAMAIDRDYGQAWNVMAKIHLNQTDSNKKAVQRTLEALDIFSKLTPSDPMGYIQRFKIYINLSKYEEANQELSRVFAVFPRFPNLHTMKGDLFLKMGNYAQALREYQLELQYEPDNLGALLGLGGVQIKMSKHQEALTSFGKAMQSYPNSAEAKNMAGYTNFLLKNFDAAIMFYRSAIKIDPANSIYYKRLGQALWESNDLQGAKEALKKYLEMEPDAPDKTEILKIL